MYLTCLYKELLNLSAAYKTSVHIYSPHAQASSLRNQLLYPVEILRLLFAKKPCENNDVILHVHWLEFLYRWGNTKYAVPFLAPFMLAFLTVYTRFSKTKLVVTMHNVLPHNVYWARTEYRFFKSVLTNLSDAVFVHSSFQKSILEEFYGLTPEKVHVLKHGLFKYPLQPDPAKKLRARKALGISPNEVVFSFIGAISEYKGVGVLLDAMQQKQGKSRIRVILAGESDKTYLRYLQKNYSKILGDKHVIFLNKRLSETELDTVLSVADFGICPYTNATTPATLMDFLIYHLPIVTTDDPNVLDVLKTYPAVVAKRGDVASLTQAISFACANSSDLTKKAVRSNDAQSFVDAWTLSAKITLTSYLAVTNR
ncbi:MAG: glycosyltransferase family 4 protein [Candidatus Bathyarchaeota archaeon]|nr:glycosyltransferase family 4 protein [Candidatus Bathyarchaeota archaeon]